MIDVIERSDPERPDPEPILYTVDYSTIYYLFDPDPDPDPDLLLYFRCSIRTATPTRKRG